MTFELKEVLTKGLIHLLASWSHGDLIGGHMTYLHNPLRNSYSGEDVVNCQSCSHISEHFELKATKEKKHFNGIDHRFCLS